MEPARPSGPLLGLLLRLASQHWAQRVDAALMAAGFSGIRQAHANVFPFVPDDGIQIGDLAALARVRKQTMAQAVEQLERAGYVERRPDPHDRRAKLVFLTARGREVRPVGVATGRRVEDEWAELIGRDELENLRATLQRLLAALSPQTGAGAERAAREHEPAEGADV